MTNMGKRRAAVASLVVALLIPLRMAAAAAAFVVSSVDNNDGNRRRTPPPSNSGPNQRHGTHCLFVKPPSFDLFGAIQNLTKPKPNTSGRASLKNDLLAICNNRDDTVATKRTQVEALLPALTTASPITATSVAPQLAQTWQVVWTTEKEINVFLDRGWATNIYQVINDSSSGTIENSIPFVNDRGSLNVQGTIAPSLSNERRTEFVFTKAMLEIAVNLPWNTEQKVRINLPPVGKGWFDTLYLDDTLRVDINSRNDILVCRPITTL
jgi:hypothetical protein